MQFSAIIHSTHTLPAGREEWPPQSCLFERCSNKELEKGPFSISMWALTHPWVRGATPNAEAIRHIWMNALMRKWRKMRDGAQQRLCCTRVQITRCVASYVHAHYMYQQPLCVKVTWSPPSQGLLLKYHVWCLKGCAYVRTWSKGYNKLTIWRLFYNNMSQGKHVKNSVANITAEFMHQLHSVSITFPWAIPCSHAPPALLLQCYCFPLSLLPVSGSWQLVSITVFPQALGCVRLMVQQQVKQQHGAAPTQHSYQQAPANSQVMSLSPMLQGHQWGGYFADSFVCSSTQLLFMQVVQW